jgi:hypothetical protein
MVWTFSIDDRPRAPYGISMNCFPSHNPSVPAENTRCAQPQNDWTAAAHRLGVELTKGPVRTRNGRAGDRLVSDLVRRGLVESRGAGWLRLTEAGRAAFPTNRCARWRQAFDMIWIDLDQQRARVCSGTGLSESFACDARPEAWRSASAALCRPCVFAPRRARVPVQIVRGAIASSNLSEPLPPECLTLEETIDLAPAREHSDWQRFMSGYWPGVGATDTFPAARIGYPGLTVERRYA